MTGSTKLMTPSGGGVTLTPANTATDKTLTIPADNGTLVYANSSGNVGIGTSSPQGKFDVTGTGDTVALVTTNTSGNPRFGMLVNGVVYNWIQANRSDLSMQFATGNTERMRIDSSGNLLVGTTSVGANSSHITVGGDSGTARVSPRTDNVGYVGDSAQRWQAIYAVNGTIQTSDGREKNTIEDSNLGLSFVQSLRPVSYKWNVGENLVTYDENQNEIVTPRAGVRTHYGFIAQEVKAAIPEGVDFGGFVQDPDDGLMSLRYHEFIGPLVKAIQELSAQTTALKAELDATKAEVAALKEAK